jgi:pilus assembly protein CpaE
MDRKTLSVLLIEDSPDYARLVQQWLSSAGEDIAFVLNWTDSLIAGLARLAQGGIDVVLLDLGLPDSDGVETFLATRRHAPGIPVIILSGADSESLALQMIQHGAEDYLDKTACNAELLVKAVRYAVIRRKVLVNQTTGNPGSERARVIGVLGSKGGVGATTVACNLAATLAHETGQDVLLADLDPNSGLISFLLNFDAKYSILDAINNVDRLDRACWDAIVAHRGGGLQVIPAPAMLRGDELTTEGLRTVFNVVRPFYQWIVIDFGRLNSVWQSLSDGIDDVLVITTTALPALHETKRMIDTLIGEGTDRERMRLVVNQTEAGHLLPGSELKQIFGVQVYAVLPNDSQELHRACLERKLASDSSAFGMEVVTLARKLAGLKEKKVKRSLLSFVGRFRNTAESVPVA